MSVNGKKKKLKIIQGEDRIVKLRLKEVDCDELESIDLTTPTEITATFTNQDKTKLEKKLTDTEVSVSNAVKGRIQVSLNDTETMALREGKDQTFKVKVEFGAESRIIKFEDCLTIESCD